GGLGSSVIVAVVGVGGGQGEIDVEAHGGEQVGRPPGVLVHELHRRPVVDCQLPHVGGEVAYLNENVDDEARENAPLGVVDVVAHRVAQPLLDPGARDQHAGRVAHGPVEGEEVVDCGFELGQAVL